MTDPRAKAPGWTGAAGTPTRLLLLRHGQTQLSVQRRYSGRGNPELTALGREQVRAGAELIASRGERIAAIVSSPLQRALQTAAVVSDLTGVPVSVDEGFIETDFGQWEGLTFAEAAEQFPDEHHAWLRDATIDPPGGESFATVGERVGAARDRVIAAHAGQTVVVVSHVTPIKETLRAALDVGPSLLYRLHLDLASLSIAEFYPDGGSSVRLVNAVG